MPVIETDWVQAGELGLAFVVIILCASLVVLVMKNSTIRETKYIEMITKFTPLMERISNSMETFKVSMESINHRLENIESTQLALTKREKNKNQKSKELINRGAAGRPLLPTASSPADSNLRSSRHPDNPDAPAQEYTFATSHTKMFVKPIVKKPLDNSIIL